MLMSNSSSSSMTSSTVSSESAPRSFTNEVSGVIFSLSTPSCSATISITRSATDATVTDLQAGICGAGSDPQDPRNGSKTVLFQAGLRLNRIEEIRNLGQDEGKRPKHSCKANE